MKVYADRLGERLAKRLDSLYLLSGDDPLLMQEAGDEIRAAARAGGFTERQLFHADPGFDWRELGQAVNSPSLFAERRLLEVRLGSAGKPDDALLDAAQRLDEDSLMLVVLPRLDASAQKTKWFKSLETLGVFIQVWPIDSARLPGWLAGRFRKRGLKASQEAVRLLAQRIEGNLLAAVQEIEQLKLIAGDQEVTAEMVEASVADSARYDVYKLLDAALAGRQARVARMVQGLKAEGSDPLYLVNVVARELRTLEPMALRLAAGQPMQAALAEARVWKSRMEPVRLCLERSSAAQLRRHLLAAGDIDRTIKGVAPGDPWRKTASLLLALAGVDMLD